MDTYKVLLVDDHELVRQGMKAAYPDVAGTPLEWLEASTLDEGLRIYQAHKPIDAVLLDLNLPDAKGLQGLRTFLHAHADARVAVLSGAQDEFVMRQARLLGAQAYICKSGQAQAVQTTLEAMLAPQVPARAAVLASASLFPRMPQSAVYDRVSELGPRHLEILELVLSGCTNQEISSATRLSLGTVKNYVSSLLLALDVRSRSHMISLFR
ncbi:MAG: response regulator transcription factor [Proteobacteria bacterium]|nr:response regulator transcription factor [Pseudomonadota bacterium]